MENKNKTMTAEEKLLNAIFGTEQQVKDKIGRAHV